MIAENCGKPFGGLGSVPNIAGGAHVTLPNPLAAGEGRQAPSPRTHSRYRLSALRVIRQPPQIFISPNAQGSITDMVFGKKIHGKNHSGKNHPGVCLCLYF